MQALSDSLLYLLRDAPAVSWDKGLEIVDTAGALVEDISADMADCEIDYDSAGTPYVGIKVALSRELAWGVTRVRPYLTVTDGQLTERVDGGVFLLTTPDTPLGETPATWQVSGWDLGYLLDDPVADTYSVDTGGFYIATVEAILDRLGIPHRIDQTAAAKTLPAPMVWPLDQNHPDTPWRTVVTDLLKGIGYQPPWLDETGRCRSGPYVTPTDRTKEFTFDVGATTSMIGVDRSLSGDVWGSPNWWRAVASSFIGVPTEGDGQVTMTNTSEGPSSFDSLGRWRHAPVLYQDVADQDALVAFLTQQVDADKHVTRTITGPLAPWPVASHLDCYGITDPALGAVSKVMQTRWTLRYPNADGQMPDMDVTWEVVS